MFEIVYDCVYNNNEDSNNDWQQDERNTFEYALLQDYFEGNAILCWNLTKCSETMMTYLLIINIYQLLMSINMYINKFFCVTWSSQHDEHNSVHWGINPTSKPPKYGNCLPCSSVLPSLLLEVIKFLVKIHSYDRVILYINVLFSRGSHGGKHWDCKNGKSLCIYFLIFQKENLMEWHFMYCHKYAGVTQAFKTLTHDITLSWLYYVDVVLNENKAA